MSRALLAALAALLLALVGACGEPAPQSTARACSDSRDCPGGQLCSCSGQCYTPAPCDGDGDCCANEVCDEGRCAERNECVGDDDCAGGRACLACACVPPPCSGDGACGEGRVCEGGVCVEESSAPCAGCDDGEACDPIAGVCVARPASCAELTCGPGETALLEGVAERLGPVCAEPLRCVCAAARPASDFRLGAVFSAALLDDGAIAVLAHEHRYDDLVYVELDAAGGERARVWVDGVPTGPVVSDPAGPRRGVLDPGFAMGRAPAAASQGGVLAVSYRDDSNATLRFAASADRRTWTAARVDGDGDVGEHSDLVPLGGGAWGIAYSALGDAEAELRWAYAAAVEPGVEPSWAIQTIAAAPIQETGPGRAFAGYPSARVRDGVVHVAWYDGYGGDLMLSWGPPGGPFRSVVLDAGETRSDIPGAGDVGRHVQLLTAADGSLAVAYLDHIAGTVLYAPLVATDEGAFALVGAPEVVAPGRQDLPPHLVGADLFATRSSATGEPMLAFQDSTAGDLVLALRTDGGWQRVVLARTGAAGFSPHIFVTPGGTLALDGVLEEGERGLAERLSLRTIPY